MDGQMEMDGHTGKQRTDEGCAGISTVLSMEQTLGLAPPS